ncbi:MAG: PfkB family carbohydrate kinase [Candidatus Geothermincolia bacterium]
MSILVVGSVALDTVKTPFGEAEEALGGAAVFFSIAASFFAPVNLVGVIGQDFPERHLDLLRERDIDLSGLQRALGKTFRWKGYYEYDLSEAHTLDTQLNVFSDFRPELPEAYRDCEFVFLANIDPELQGVVLDQVRSPRLVVCDTMNFWIENKRDELIKTIGRVDVMMLNEAEARELAGEPNLVLAARKIMAMGPKRVIIKKGEHGVCAFHDCGYFILPGYPLEYVFDPTGAGDSFGGGFLGAVAAAGDVTEQSIRKAVVYGSVLASFNVEAFSCERLRGLSREEIEARYEDFLSFTSF